MISREPRFISASSRGLQLGLALGVALGLSATAPSLAAGDGKTVPPTGGKNGGADDARRGIPQGKDHLYCCHPGPHGTLEGRMLEVDAPAPLAPLDSAWEFETIRWFGPSDNRIDMVFVGDGYQANDLLSYRTQVEQAWQFLEVREPYATYRRYFNVHRVDVISVDEGVDNDPTQGIARNTALDMAYWADGSTERLLGVNTAKAQQAAGCAPDWDQILAVANSSKYGGAGYGGADVGTFAGSNSASFAVAEHELGHSFGDLADEYDYDADPPNYSGPELTERNVSIRDRATMIADNAKWVDWLGVPLPVVGTHDCFEGAFYHETGVYRPTADSLMRNLNLPYNGPSIEQMIVKIHLATKMADSFSHPVGSTFRAGSSVQATLVEPTTHSLVKVWRVGGVVVPGATGASFETGSLVIPPGGTSLQLEVIDPNPLVRNNFNKVLVMREAYSWVLLPPDGLTCASALTVNDSDASTKQFDTRLDIEPTDDTACGTSDIWAVWRRVVAPCTGMMQIDACPTAFASNEVTLAMSEECGLIASCSTTNAAGCIPATSGSIRFGVLAGEDYYIRISAAGNGDVAGSLTITCTPGCSSGSCYTARTTPGCSNASCCATTCTADPFCCDASWDQLCVDRANATCRSGLDCLEARHLDPNYPSSYLFNTGDQAWPSGSSSCGTQDGREVWRSYTPSTSGLMTAEICTEFAESQPTLALYAFDPASGSCGTASSVLACSASPAPDCPLGPSVRLQWPVLQNRTYLIRIAANQNRTCAGSISVTTDAVCGSGGACDEIHFSPGCSDAECCVNVCAADPYCCTDSWDLICVQTAGNLCGGVPSDLNNDGSVNAADLTLLLGAWGSAGGPADLDGDGTVGAADLAILLGGWTG